MEFSVKFDKNGNLVFATDSMAYSYRKAKEFYSKTGTFFKMTIEEQTRLTTDNQIKLFERLCFMVSGESGNSFKEVKDNLLYNFLPRIHTGNSDLLGDPITKKKELKELTTKEFENLLLASVSFCNEFFNMNIELHSDDNVGTILTNKRN